MKKALALTMIASTLVFAGTTTSSTTVTATAEPTCSINNSPSISLEFTGLDDSVGNFNVDIICNNGLNYTMTIDGGTSPSGELRRATDGTNFITYRLYSDATMTTELGAVTGNQITGSGTDNSETINIYTKVAVSDNNPLPPIGTYNDTLTITLSW
jgi:spore coat protein U-like protein